MAEEMDISSSHAGSLKTFLGDRHPPTSRSLFDLPLTNLPVGVQTEQHPRVRQPSFGSSLSGDKNFSLRMNHASDDVTYPKRIPLSRPKSDEDHRRGPGVQVNSNLQLNAVTKQELVPKRSHSKPSQPKKSFESLLNKMQAFIQRKKNLTSVKIDLHTFLEPEQKHCRLVCIVPPGCRETSRLRIAEKDTRYENISRTQATISHTSNFDERKLIGNRKSKSAKIGIGGPIAVNFFPAVGASAEIVRFDFSKTTENYSHEDKGESHTYSVKIQVPAQEIAIVKQVIYEVEKEAECQLELVFPKEKKISYTGKTENGEDVQKSTTIWKEMLSQKDFEWAVREENDSFILLVTDICHSTTFEHSVQVIGTGPPDKTRFQAILGTYETSDTADS